MSKIQLGSKVKCLVTGFVGIVTSRHEYLNGCWRMGVQAPVDKDGKVPEALTFDDMQLAVIEDPKEIKAGLRDTGGPRTDPVEQRSVP